MARKKQTPSQKQTEARIARAAYEAARDNPDAFPGALEGVAKKTERWLESGAGARIVKAGVRTFSDTGKTQAWVEWSDGGRSAGDPESAHMKELIRRAEREGVRVQFGEVV